MVEQRIASTTSDCPQSKDISVNLYKNDDGENNLYFTNNIYENTILDDTFRNINVRGSVVMVSGFTGMGNTSFLNWANVKIGKNGAPTVLFTFTDDDFINFRRYKFLADAIANYKISNKLKKTWRE